MRIVVQRVSEAGVAIDSIRLCKLALNRNASGVLEVPSACFCKHPPKQYPDDVAFDMLEKFIADYKKAKK